MNRTTLLDRTPLSILVALGLVAATPACGSSGDDGASPGGGTADGGTSAEGGGSGGDASTNDASLDGVVAVPLKACVPLVYSADVSIGAQDFQLIVDTGSTSLGVAGAGCTNCAVTPLYQPGTSAADQNKTATAQFGSGSWSGEIYEDAVGFKSDPTIPLKFASITKQTGFFQAGSTCGGKAYHGLMGFGRSKAAVAGTEGYFDQLVAGTSVADVFATELCDDGGTLWLGGFDPKATTGAPQYTPFTKDVASGFYYTVNLATVSVNGTSVAIPTTSYADTVVDTGTSAFLVGQTAFTQMTGAISASAGFQQLFGADAGGTWFDTSKGGVACAKLGMAKAQIDALLPPLTLAFAGGVEIKAVATESYLMPMPGQGWCNALVPAPQGQSFPVAAIMGAPVLRSSVVIIDRAKGQVGFAPHAACPASTAVSRDPLPSSVKLRLPFSTLQ